ncbi:astacin-like metalloendopeptidase [Spea bombifrons]|uniref:astacin-like metalloendopeptidase n=1 Tax=Spea bombifrons TaxID=233779 RepID=UPI00234B7F74|nr:astacin-like metalloendopeptidase [Spea bombifrons]
MHVHTVNVQKRGTTNIDDEDDVFSIISKNNKGSKKLIHQGDIAVRFSRSALNCPGKTCLWPKSAEGLVFVPYTLSPEYTAAEAEVIFSAMEEYTTLTCLRFTKRKTETDHVQIRSLDGCWSYLGKVGGPQDLSLVKSGCVSKGIVQHELNHVLGFIHEHTRSDRDSYVDIVWANIPDAYASNFAKSEMATDTPSLRYDYTSVMHYGRYAFSNVPGQATINPKPDSTVPIGQRYGLSNLDLQKINRLYECDVCSALLCDPSGRLNSVNINPMSSDKSLCVWLIRVPANKVFLQFETTDTPAGSYGHIKVYNGASRTSPQLLNRLCTMGIELPPLVSFGNVMLVEFSSDGTSSFTASYSTVICGGTLMTWNGTLTSAGFPIKYPSSADCTWTIVAPVGYRILLNFTSFSLESSKRCIYDYLSIYDGSGSSGPVRYCGTRKIPVLVSSGSWILMRFHTDKSVQSMGFEVKYMWVTSS